MKKKIAALLTAFLLIACCACDVTLPSQSFGGGNGDGTGGPEKEAVEYKVSLILEGKPYYPVDELSAVWTGTDGVFSAPFNAEGVATVTGPDGEYAVTLSAMPSGYTYDPNGYYADGDHTETSIELLRIIPARTGGKGTSNYDCIRIDTVGTYRTTLTSASQKVFYSFYPTMGSYIIESWVDITPNLVNPLCDLYVGTFAYSKFVRQQDGGGASSWFTKNFRLEYSLAKDEEGNTMIFCIYAECDSGTQFPVTIDFTISRVGDYERQDYQYETMVAEGPFYDEPTPAGSWRYIYENTNGLLDGSLVGLNPHDNFYHLYNAASGQYDGALLYAILTRNSEVIVAQDDRGKIVDVGFMFPLIILAKVVNGEARDYTDFIRVTYSAHCNAENGAHPVNEELKGFLQMYAVGEPLFKDGYGWAETNNFARAGNRPLTSGEDDMWLFNCGYYA